MPISINETGYKPENIKCATVSDAGVYLVIDCKTRKPVFSGKAKHIGFDNASGDDCFSFDFTKLKKKGVYYISKENLNSSDSVTSSIFAIGDNVYEQLQKDMLKCLYYQRCGVELTEEYAGEYKHACCHTDASIMLEDYLNHNENCVKYDMTGGWHDAGDFGRYITPAAVTIGHLLYAYELFPDSFKVKTGIPERVNGIPDVLDEVKYELDWMLKMKASDGGVYHKLTAFNHAEFIMPEDDHDQFIIYPVSSIATADFAACMALASRVYREFDSEYADTLLTAAKDAYKWLDTHDYIGFKNPKGSNTGEYDDESDMDERMWAAAELLRTDVDGDSNHYLSDLEKYVFSDIPKTDFGWTDVAGFTLLAVLTSQDLFSSKIKNTLKKSMNRELNRLIKIQKNSGYGVAMLPDDYVWGSNMVVSNRGILFALKSYLSYGNTAKKFYNAACNQLNYLLGRNALQRSYVTGYGEHAFKNPHNRTTACDGVELPMKGWVSGGPFKTPNDEAAKKIIPVGTPPMKCHADVVGSYSTNEITIYWNSSVIFITALLNHNI